MIMMIDYYVLYQTIATSIAEDIHNIFPYKLQINKSYDTVQR